jgi:dCTP diphosphatase
VDEVKKMTRRIAKFRDERDWKQFHNHKDMAVAISIEANELLEHFLWKTPEQCEKRVAEKEDEIADEIADIAMFLFELADNCGIDVIRAMDKKLAKNAKKYSVAKAKGRADKYTEL